MLSDIHDVSRKFSPAIHAQAHRIDTELFDFYLYLERRKRPLFVLVLCL